MDVTLKEVTDHAGADILIEVTLTPTLHIMAMMYGQMSGRDYKTDASEALFVEVDSDITVD